MSFCKLDLSDSDTVFVKENSLPQTIRDLERTSLSAIIKMMSSVANLEWRVLIGQCFIIGVVSSVATLEWRALIGQCFTIGIVSSVCVLKMRASDWTVLWTMHHLFIPFYSIHSERKVVPIVHLVTL